MPGPTCLPRRLGALACAAALSLLAACGGGDGGSSSNGPPAASCSEAARKQWVLDVAREWYLFQDSLPATVNLGSHATADELLDALTAAARAEGKDRYFSYLTTRAAENALLGQGEFIGFGFRNRTDDGNRPFVLDVYEGSPAAEQGLQRGDEIVAVDEGNGFVPVAESLVGGKTLSDLLGAAEAGVRRGLRLLHAGAQREIYMTKRTVTIDPVPAYGVQVLDLGGVPSVGYLHLRSYISPADPQLVDAFGAFAGLRYFIVDLRYNGGGLVSTAELINNLLGAALAGEVQYRMVHNAAKSQQNSTVRFAPRAQSAAPVRIAFLTTDATASASEININSMQPWVDAALIGSDTYGKPVGQLAFDLGGCEDRLRLVAFKTVNALDQGDYYDGLASTFGTTCAAADTLDAPLGSPDDTLVRTALGWLGGNEATTCTPMAASPGAQAKPLQEPETRYPRPLQPTPAEHWLPGVN